jgi:hypothetical protein
MAPRLLRKDGFRWKDLTKGLYKDGHEREDVVTYRENAFLPMMADLEPKMVAEPAGPNDPTQDWRNLYRTGGHYTGPYPGTQHLSGPQQELCLKTSEVKNLHACEQFFFSLPSAGLPPGQTNFYIQAAQEGPEMVTAHVPETVGGETALLCPSLRTSRHFMRTMDEQKVG